MYLFLICADIPDPVTYTLSISYTKLMGYGSNFSKLSKNLITRSCVHEITDFCMHAVEISRYICAMF